MVNYSILWLHHSILWCFFIRDLPKPLYTPDALLDYIEACIDELVRDYPASPIVLAGDFNQLPDDAVAERTGLTQLVQQPTRGANILDRLYVSEPNYSTIRVVASVVRSDHRAVMAHPHHQPVTVKTSDRKTFRR